MVEKGEKEGVGVRGLEDFVEVQVIRRKWEGFEFLPEMDLMLEVGATVAMKVFGDLDTTGMRSVWDGVTGDKHDPQHADTLYTLYTYTFGKSVDKRTGK